MIWKLEILHLILVFSINSVLMHNPIRNCIVFFLFFVSLFYFFLNYKNNFCLIIRQVRQLRHLC